MLKSAATGLLKVVKELEPAHYFLPGWRSVSTAKVWAKGLLLWATWLACQILSPYSCLGTA